MRRLQDIGTTASISTSGATPIVSQIEDVLAGIQSTLSQIITEYNAEVYPVISSLPQGRDDTRWKMANNAIYPKRNYLDGNNIFVDSTASARVDDGRYWRTDLLRPRTIKESFSQLYTEIQDQIDGLRTSISSYTNEGLTAAQKARIGMNIFDPILPSSASSLDGLTQTHELNFTQVGKDLYGASWSLDGDGLENLYYSVKEMVDALLQIHGGAWDTDVSVFHSSWGTPLSISEEGVSVEPGVANIDFVGASVTATQTAPGSVEIEVTTSYWGAVADTSELPNVVGASVQDAALAAGDTAYVTADSALYLCIVDTVGSALWVSLLTGGRVLETPLVDTTDHATSAGISYPDDSGLEMEGYRDLSFTGKFICGANNTISFTVEGTNDEDATPANRDWISIYAYRSDANTVVNSIACGSAATVTFGWDFDNCNYKYVRVRLVITNTGVLSNTVVIIARQKSL
jgi:hypothetical protein